MSTSDHYYKCDNCGKALFFDTDLQDEDRFEAVGQMGIICKKCNELFEVVIKLKTFKTTKAQNDG